MAARARTWATYDAIELVRRWWSRRLAFSERTGTATWDLTCSFHDIAGWRLERAPRDRKQSGITIPPDWICEICSPSSRLYDRQVKMATYSANGVAYAWMIDRNTLEIYRLDSGGWSHPGTHADHETVRAEPFDSMQIDLARIFSAPPVR